MNINNAIDLLKDKNVCISKEISDEMIYIYGCDENNTVTANGYGIYNGICVGGYRYYLEINVDSVMASDKKLTALMLNPSATFPNEEWGNDSWKLKLNTKKKNKGFDSTVRNVIRLAKCCGYSHVVILNSFPYINGNGRSSIDFYNKYKNEKQFEYNIDFIKKYLKANLNDDILIAWGGNIPKELKEEYLKLLKGNKNLKCYAWNENKNCPYHPSQQVDNSTYKIRNFLLSGLKALETVEINEKLEVIRKN